MERTYWPAAKEQYVLGYVLEVNTDIAQYKASVRVDFEVRLFEPPRLLGPQSLRTALITCQPVNSVFYPRNEVTQSTRGDAGCPALAAMRV